MDAEADVDIRKKQKNNIGSRKLGSDQEQHDKETSNTNSRTKESKHIDDNIPEVKHIRSNKTHDAIDQQVNCGLKTKTEVKSFEMQYKNANEVKCLDNSSDGHQIIVTQFKNSETQSLCPEVNISPMQVNRNKRACPEVNRNKNDDIQIIQDKHDTPMIQNNMEAARLPPRKIQRSSAPRRNYDQPMITTNLQYSGGISSVPQNRSIQPQNKDIQIPLTRPPLQNNGPPNSDSNFAAFQNTLKGVLELRSEIKSKAATINRKRQLPRIKNPNRLTTHWDLLLDEMKWMATDFTQERNWKYAIAWRMARDVCEARCAEKITQEREKRKLARSVAMHISAFWRAMERIAARSRFRVEPAALLRSDSKTLQHSSSFEGNKQTKGESNSSLEWTICEENIEEGIKDEVVRVRQRIQEIYEIGKLARKRMKAGLDKSCHFNFSDIISEINTQHNLAPFQTNALLWMSQIQSSGLNMLLNDQLGTGKPFTVSAFLRYLQLLEKKGASAKENISSIDNPHLVVCPDAEVHKWAHYIKLLHPGARIQLYGGTAVERHKQQLAWDKDFAEHQSEKKEHVYCCICSHSLFMEQHSAQVFSRQMWKVIIIEDAIIDTHRQTQNICSSYNSLQNYGCRILVSETSLENWTTERNAIWGEFLLKEHEKRFLHVAWDEWNTATSNSVHKLMKIAGIPWKEETTGTQVALRCLTLGRLRNDMEAQLGKVEEINLSTNMTTSQVYLYICISLHIAFL